MTNVIPQLRARWMMCVAIAAGLAAAAAIAGLLLVLVATDAAIVLPATLRAATLWLILAVLAAVIAMAVRSLVRATELHVAHAIEQHDPSFGSSISNAVQFTSEPGDTPINQLLRRQAIEQGRRRGQTARVAPAVRRRMVVSAIAAVVAILLWSIGSLVTPDVFHAVLPRLFDPYGDHPPYSPIKIEVVAEPVQVLYGGQCDIFAKVSGGAVEQLTLVIETSGDGCGETSGGMYRRPDRSWFHTLTNLRHPMRFFVTDGRARTRLQSIEIVYTPRIEHVELTCDYPAYTKLKAEKIAAEDRDIIVPVGTTVAARVVSNRPLRDGSGKIMPLIGGSEQSIVLTADPQQPTAVTGRFQVEQDVAVALNVTDVDGRTCSEPRSVRIRSRPDRRPLITITEPGHHAVATPDVAIPVRVQAEDDYGIEQVLWFRSINDSVETSTTIALPARADGRRANVDTRFNLADLGVRPGDVIEYFFEAVDNDPRGPNIATSRIYSIQIISRVQYEQIVRSMAIRRELFSQYAEMNQAMRRLAERAEALAQKAAEAEKTGGGSEAQRTEAQKEAAALAEQMAQLQKHMQDAAAQKALFDIDPHFKKEMSEQAAQLDELQKQAQDLAGACDPKAAKQLADAMRQMAGDVNREVGEPAQLLTEVARLLYQADRFAQLTVQQGELAQLSRRYQDPSQPLSRARQMELQELSAAQAGIQQQLNALLEELPRQLEALPADPQFDTLRKDVKKYLAAAGELAIPDQMSAAAQRFAAMEGQPGYEAAAEAHRRMETLLARCNSEEWGDKAGICLRFQPSLREHMGRSLAQIMAAMRGGMPGPTGPSGQGGYSLFSDQVGLYGPDMQLTGAPSATGHGDGRAAASGEGKGDSVAGSGRDPGLDAPSLPGRVRLQQDVAFPLEFRTLVGEYFRAVAESQEK